MKSVFKPLLLAGLLATVGFGAFSQPMGGSEGRMTGMGPGGAMCDGMGHDRMGKMSSTRMQSMMDKRNAELKAKLKLTPAQEGAWTTFTAAMKSPVGMMTKYPDPAEMAKLSTPERIDKTKTLRTQHMTEMTSAMDQRGEATKTFYATLTPEQQKVFDANAMRHQGERGRMGRMQGDKGQPAAKP